MNLLVHKSVTRLFEGLSDTLIFTVYRINAFQMLPLVDDKLSELQIYDFL